MFLGYAIIIGNNPRRFKMGNTVRITNVEITNLKNVKKGHFRTNSSFDYLNKSDVVGFYGQNGSGKTAAVEAFNLLKILLSPDSYELPDVSKYLVYFNEEAIELLFEFLISNDFGEFFVKYKVSLKAGTKKLYVIKEQISYRENIKNKRFKVIISKDGEDISVRNQKANALGEDERVSVMVANKMASGNFTSFVFREELKDILQSYLNDTEAKIIKNLAFDFDRDFHVISATNYGLLVANMIMPFSIHLENKRGEIPYNMQDTMILPVQVFKTIEKVIEQTNIVLQDIIPGLQIRIRKIHEQKMDDGKDGIRFEFLSKKDYIELPLRSESAGILKLISILSTLTAVFNNPNACVVIDELDASVFEYLLGELLEVISENGQGQLFFTSHNLRILELLPKHNLWFTTDNENNRYIQLKGIKKMSNARDIYLRALQLGGQEESIYAETDRYDIKTSFRKAGYINEK